MCEELKEGCSVVALLLGAAIASILVESHLALRAYNLALQISLRLDLPPPVPPVPPSPLPHGHAPDNNGAAVAGGEEGETVGGEPYAVHATLVLGEGQEVVDGGGTTG